MRLSSTLPIVAALGLAAPLSAGCVRTDDGTLLLSERSAPMQFNSMMDPARYSTSARHRRDIEQRASEFPHPPRGQYRWRSDPPRSPGVGSVRVGVAAPFRPAASPNEDLTCRNEVSANGRVRVVCD